VALVQRLTGDFQESPGSPVAGPGDQVTAQLAAPVLITYDGAQSGIQVALRPPGARALPGTYRGEPRKGS